MERPFGLKALLKDGGGEEFGKMVLSYARLLANANESDADPGTMSTDQGQPRFRMSSPNRA